MSTALAPLQDMTPQVPPQQEQILAQLPQMHPEIRTILKGIKEAQKLAEQHGHLEMVGHGLHGEYSQVVEGVDPSLIWEADTYIRRELDMEMDNLTHQRFREMLLASTRDEITNPSTGYVMMDEYDIVIVVDRPEDPSDPYTRTMLLLKGRAAWKLAMHHNRKVRVVVLPDIPDYHLRDIGLRLALRESAVDPWQVIYHLQMMVEDLKAGRCAKTALVDQPLKGKDIAQIVGCSPQWVSRVKTVLFNPITHPYIISHRVTPQIASDIILGSRGDEGLCAELLQVAAQQHLHQAQVKQLIYERTHVVPTLPLRPATSVQRPTPAPLPPPDPYEGSNLHDLTEPIGVLAFTASDASGPLPVFQGASPVDRVRQHVLLALKEIEEQRDWFEDQFGLQHEDINAGIEALEGVLMIFPSQPIG